MTNIQQHDPDNSLRITLIKLNLNFKVDTKNAENLKGESLRAWVEKAEDDLFVSLMAAPEDF